MIKWIEALTNRNIDRDLETAIFWKNSEKVAQLLKRGANPNGWAGQQTYLGLAMFRNALPIIKQLLAAGADPREPYYLAGAEYRLSAMARHFNLPEIADLLEEAEREAEARLGPRPLRNYLACPRRPSP
jgi:ankyrin repeat protein